MNLAKKLALGFKMFLNSKRIKGATSYRSSLVMALKLLEMPPEVKGCVIECGCWKGRSTTNLSLLCKIVSRRLLIFDTFEGLPETNQKHYQEN